MASVPHPTGKYVDTESNRIALASCFWHLLAGLPQTYIVTLTLGSIAWKMVIISALRDYCRIKWDNACKVQQVPTMASAPQNGMVITLTTSPGSLHLPHSLPAALFLLRQGWFLMCDFLTRANDLAGCPILSLNTLILSSDARVWWHGKPQNKPGNVWSQTTQSHCETLSRATHAPRLMGILSLGSGTVYPFVPSETFWSRGCRMSPSRSWVFLQPPRRLPPVSSFICSVGNMIPSPSARLDAHKPATECVLPPERNTLIKYVAGVSNPQVEILCSSEHSPLVGTVLSLKVLYHKYLHREIGY